MEEKVMISHVLRKFRVESVTPRNDLELVGEIILRPFEGIRVKLVPRRDAETAPAMLKSQERCWDCYFFQRHHTHFAIDSSRLRIFMCTVAPCVLVQNGLLCSVNFRPVRLKSLQFTPWLNRVENSRVLSCGSDTQIHSPVIVSKLLSFKISSLSLRADK